MSSKSAGQEVRQLIDKDRWTDILNRFIDVLRINIFLIDRKGHTVIPPAKRGDGKAGYGLDFLVSALLKVNFPNKRSNFLKNFKKEGHYWEHRNEFNLFCYAIPILSQSPTPIAFLVVGPVILNKRLENRALQRVAKDLKVGAEIVLDSLDEIRVLSFVAMKSILELLDEITTQIIQLKSERDHLHRLQTKGKVKALKVAGVSEDIYSSIYRNEVLAMLLDLALKMTKTENGSIMIVDPKADTLTIQVAQGIDAKSVQGTKQKIGEGIAGLAAKTEETFVIRGLKGNEKIRALLKRPEIKKSLVMPLKTDKAVYGILNLHTKKMADKIEENLDNLKYITKIISAAVHGV